MKLYDLFDEYLKSISISSSKTLKCYIEDFKSFFRNIDIYLVTINDVQKFINFKRAMNLKESTIDRYYRLLKTIFNYAISHEYIIQNPCKGIVIKHQKYTYKRDIDYSKRYIKKLLKLYKKTKLYYIVLTAVHTRYEKNRIAYID